MRAITQDEKGQIALLTQFGCDLQTAAEYNGLTVNEVQNAIMDDTEFDTQMAKSQAQAALAHFRNMNEAAKDPRNWRVSLWWLQQRRERQKQTPRTSRIDITLEIIRTQSEVHQLIEKYADKHLHTGLYSDFHALSQELSTELTNLRFRLEQ